MEASWRGMALRQPATRWQDALPAGNGTIGALVYGHIQHELVLLNHQALPNVSDRGPELRALLDAGRYSEAEGFLDRALRERAYAPGGIDAYHPAFDLAIDTGTRAPFTGYRRQLDFRTGEASVRWREDAAEHRRDLFVSRADDVVVVRLLPPDPATVTCAIGLVPHDLDGLAAMGSGKDRAARAVPLAFEAGAEAGWLTLQARYRDGGGYGGLARVVARGGTIEVDGTGVRIASATEVLVLIKVIPDEPLAPALERLRTELAALPAEYDALLARHAVKHAALFDRLDLDMGGGEGRARQRGAAGGGVRRPGAGRAGRAPLRLRPLPADRSSRPGTQPANLQGLWNETMRPPGKQTTTTT